MGQTIISAGLIIIVTITVINANRLVVTAETTKMEGLARMQAADIAMALITEARMKRFDESAVTSSYQSTSAFTSPWGLGQGGSETITLPDVYPYASAAYYDDFDDYNGYSRTVNTSNIPGYSVACEVFYATQTAPDTKVMTKTYVKTMVVRVSHPLYLPNAIRISFTNSY